MTTTKAPSTQQLQRVSWRDVTSEGHAWTYVETNDPEVVESHRLVETNPEFVARVQLLLDVPADAQVSVLEERVSVNPWGCDTWEHSSAVEVRAGDREATFNSLRHLLTALEYAGVPPLTCENLYKNYLSHYGKFTVCSRNGGTQVVHARLGNAKGREVLLVLPASSDEWKGAKADADDMQAGATKRWLRVWISNVLAFERDETTHMCMDCDVLTTDPVKPGNDPLCASCKLDRICVTCGDSYPIRKTVNGQRACFSCWYSHTKG
ncbi:hypothetical protein V5R04_07220 [Jonesiaceae bacterium BS-20]|uniref:Uncharacterized protein n=1 Tax=Jonesiaceae bacterium BS-20 TaxID=3120821 RepID=A0AAU7E0Z3_9MICO